MCPTHLGDNATATLVTPAPRGGVSEPETRGGRARASAGQYEGELVGLVGVAEEEEEVASANRAREEDGDSGEEEGTLRIKGVVGDG